MLLLTHFSITFFNKKSGVFFLKNGTFFFLMVVLIDEPYQYTKILIFNKIKKNNINNKIHFFYEK